MLVRKQSFMGDRKIVIGKIVIEEFIPKEI
jgi:hypothetical protein